jgi:hypothetical protein
MLKEKRGIKNGNCQVFSLDQFCKMETTLAEIAACHGLNYVSEFYECVMKIDHL